MHREGRSAADWRANYGKEAISKPPNPELMVNLGKFSKFASVPMPLDVQLRSIKQERMVQSAELTQYEKVTYPKKADYPVSEMSVEKYGDAAWHSQPKQEKGAPFTYQPWEPPKHRWDKRRWDVERIQFVREGLAPAHVAAREIAEGTRKDF